MVKVQGIEFYNSPIAPVYSSNANNLKLEDKSVVNDNNELNPMTLAFELFYKIASNDEDPREKRQFLENLHYKNEELITIEDLTGGIIYENMMLQRLGDWQLFKDGFIVKVNFKQALLTTKAEPGATSSVLQRKNTKYVKKPLKEKSVKSDFLPSVTKENLENMGITADENGNFNLSCLDIGIDNIKNNISEAITTTLGSNDINFNIFPDGTFEILKKGGEYIAAGQRLISNVELLANLIPGVNFSLRLLPMSQKIIDQYFDILSLGTDWELVLGEIKEEVTNIGL